MCNKFDTTNKQDDESNKIPSTCTIIEDKVNPALNNDKCDTQSQDSINVDKKPILLMMDSSKTPKRLVWNMNAKSWEWKAEPKNKSTEQVATDSK